MLARGNEYVTINVGFETPVSNILRLQSASKVGGLDPESKHEASDNEAAEGLPDGVDRPWILNSDPVDTLVGIGDFDWV